MSAAPAEKNDTVPRFWFCLVFTVPLYLRTLDPWAQWMLSTIVLSVGAYPFYQKGVTTKFNRYTLIVSSLSLLYLYSLLDMLFAAAPKLYFEPIAAITSFLNLGMLMEEVLEEKARLPLQKLEKLAPTKARKLFYDGHLEEISIEKIIKDDGIRVSQDEVIPVDGVIFSGYGLVDESLFTGNSKPVEKAFGQQVFAGTHNLKETFIVRALNVGNETMLAKILKKVSNALDEKEDLSATGSLFIPIVIGLSILGLLAGSLFSGLAGGVCTAATILIIANPKAILLATTQPKDQAIIAGAAQGILISSKETLEKIAKVNMLVFGKRGILTGTNFSIVAVETTPNVSERELLATAASLEATSSHPLAEQIIERARLSGVMADAALEEEIIPGLGIKGKIDNKTALIGDEKLMEAIELDSLKARAKEFRKNGYVVLFCAKEQKLLGIIAILDPFRQGTKEAMTSLKSMGLKLFCLTGDRRITVVQAVEALGIDRFQAEAKPTQKLATLKKLSSEGNTIAFLGDPTKNADSFAKVDVSIANGIGSDYSGFGASVTLIRPGLSGVVRLFQITRNCQLAESQNLFIAYGYNIVALILALFGGVSLITATLAMALSTLVVAFRSLQIQK